MEPVVAVCAMALTANSARHIAKTNIKTFLIFCFLSLKPKTGSELIEFNSLANRSGSKDQPNHS
jgi:hypothetical protein